MKKNLIIALACLWVGHTSGQETGTWSAEAGIGGITMLENSYDDGTNYVNEDQGNNFYITADYTLTRRLTLTAGATLEQQGLFTEYADGIGLKTINMCGLHAGAKYYFLPRKWVVQPYVGASLYTNFLNLGHQNGKSIATIEQGYPGSHATITYDVNCPALSLAPRIGADIHLISSLSFTIAYDLRFGLWGRNKGLLHYHDGPVAGENYGIDERNQRKAVTIGLKMDFPVKPVSEKSRNNIFMILYSWLLGQKT